MDRIRRAVGVLALITACGTALCAEPPALIDEPAQPDAIARKIGFDQNLGADLPLDLQFRDESGRMTPLRNYFHPGRPVILLLGYYGCPMLCGAMLNSLTGCLKLISLNAETDFEVVMVSIDPTESPGLASKKKTEYLREYKRAGADEGWHFLTGETEAIAALAKAAGYRYVYDVHSRQYAHPSGIIVATPKGKISRYFMGVDYPARDIRLSLVEASGETIGAITDKLLLLCYRYDPATGKYGLIVINAVRIGGALTVGAFLLFVGLSLWRDRKNAVRFQAAMNPPGGSLTPIDRRTHG